MAKNLFSLIIRLAQIVVFWVVLPLLFLELASRIFIIPPETLPHLILNHAWRPGSKIYRGACAFTVNKQGWLHSVDLVETKSADEFRVFYLGDSFTAGECGANITDIVRTELSPDVERSGRHLTLVNAGVPSYSPTMFYLQLINYIAPFSPDLLVVNVDMTDVFDDYLASQIAERDQHGEVVAVPRGGAWIDESIRTAHGLRPRPWYSKVLRRLGEWSYAAELLSTKIDSLLYYQQYSNIPKAPHYQKDPFAWCHDPWSPETNEDVEATFKQLTRIVNFARSKNIRLVLTAVPHLGQFTGEYSKLPFEKLKSFAEAKDVDFIDSLALMNQAIGSENPAEYYRDNDMHMVAKGYKLWGKLQADYFTSNWTRLLSKPAGVAD